MPRMMRRSCSAHVARAVDKIAYLVRFEEQYHHSAGKVGKSSLQGKSHSKAGYRNGGYQQEVSQVPNNPS